MQKTYSKKRDSLQVYFDQTASKAWEALTNDTPVSRVRSLVRKGRQEMQNLLLSNIPESLSGISILDAGCGTGQLAQELGLRGARVVGVDVAPSLIEIARKRLPAELKERVTFKISDMKQDQGKFDYVILMDSLIHYSENDVLSVLQNLLKRTKKGLLFTLVPGNFLLKFKLAFGRIFPNGDRSPISSPLNTNTFIKKYKGPLSKTSKVEICSLGRVNKWFYTSEAFALKI